jgi:hypothetical protein
MVACHHLSSQVQTFFSASGWTPPLPKVWDSCSTTPLAIQPSGMSFQTMNVVLSVHEVAKSGGGVTVRMRATLAEITKSIKRQPLYHLVH